MVRNLEIRFHGRVIEHLGIDMYQSPVAAIAELISNSWDADATRVDVTLPDNLGDDAEITIADNGYGMTFEQCQDRYLKVGYNRRKAQQTDKTPLGRPVMGRKGIGKFAGFGIAGEVDVATTSEETGEFTAFRLDLSKLLRSESEDDYADSTPLTVDVLEHYEPKDARRAEHGTKLTLRKLTLSKTPNHDQFRRSMARRFLLMGKTDEFTVTVNDEPLPASIDEEKIEFDFPGAYEPDQRPAGMTLVDGWGREDVAGNEVRWRISFYKDTISEEEIAGIAVFSHGKLAQRPFLFQLTGGYSGQQGTAYMSGRVEADFIDEQATDLISTERQRINWDHEATQPLLEWGRQRVRDLLKIWKDRRAEAKVNAIEKRLTAFSTRLEKLDRLEKQVVKRALRAIARISVLSDEQFAELANAILTAWEGGRLRDLVQSLAEAKEMDAEQLVSLLAESEVMTALHAAERVKAQLNLIVGLEARIEGHELENAIRDYIANSPWLISPKWETFKVETGVSHLLEQAADASGFKGDDWKGRVDLALGSGDHLLVVEFMRPGLKADWEHIDRFERYVRILREKIPANSRFRRVTGLMVADHLEERAGMPGKLESLRGDDMEVRDWMSLLAEAKDQWREYFRILFQRAPEDGRMQRLASEAAAVDVSDLQKASRSRTSAADESGSNLSDGP